MTVLYRTFDCIGQIALSKNVDNFFIEFIYYIRSEIVNAVAHEPN